MKMKRIKFSGTLRYDQIAQSKPEDYIYFDSKERKNMSYTVVGFCRPNRSQRENKRIRKARLISGFWQRSEKAAEH